MLIRRYNHNGRRGYEIPLEDGRSLIVWDDVLYGRSQRADYRIIQHKTPRGEHIYLTETHQTDAELRPELQAGAKVGIL